MELKQLEEIQLYQIYVTLTNYILKQKLLALYVAFIKLNTRKFRKWVKALLLQ